MILTDVIAGQGVMIANERVTIAKTTKTKQNEIAFEGRALIPYLGEIMNEGELQKRSQKKDVGDDDEPIERR